MKTLNSSAVALLGVLVGCTGSVAATDSSARSSIDTSSPDGTGTETNADDEGLSLSDISGEWHGSIGPDYRTGCLCLTLGSDGGIVSPSGITLDFPVTDNGGASIVDADAREILIETLTLNVPFDIKNAYVEPDGSRIEGDWADRTADGSFDGPIELDRDPETCEERTGMGGAPC